MRKAPCIALLAAVTAMVMASGSRAESISGPHNSTQITSVKTDWVDTNTQGIAFPKFDPSLGTLESVELVFNGSMSTTLTVTNTAPSASSGNVRTELAMVVQDAGNHLNGVLGLTDTPTVDILSPKQSFSLTVGQQLPLPTKTASNSSDDIYTDPVILSEFTGSGNINLIATSLTQRTTTITSGNTSTSDVTYGSLSGTVIYTYVPEPVSVTLLGIAAMGLLARRRQA